MKKSLLIIIACFIGFAAYRQGYGAATSSTPQLDEWLRQMMVSANTERTTQPKEPIIKPIVSNTGTQATQNTTSTFGTNVLVYTSSPNDPKTHGRKIRVEYPETWQAKPGVSPHNLYKFIDQHYGNKELKGRTCLINIVDVGENISEAGWKSVFSDPNFTEDFTSNFGNVLYSKATRADNLPALMFMNEIVQEQLGIRAHQKALVVSIGYKNTMISLVCTALGDTQSTAARIFDESKGIFLQFMNSFKCLDRWENAYTPDDTSKYSLEEELTSLVKPKMREKDFQNMATVMADNAQIGDACIKTQADLIKIQNNPNVFLAYGSLGIYSMLTDGLQDYCAQYTVPYNFISLAKSAFASRKAATENKIKNIMGAEYLSCIKNDLLTSEYAKSTFVNSLNRARNTLGMTRADLCKEFANNPSVLLQEISDIFRKIGF